MQSDSPSDSEPEFLRTDARQRRNLALLLAGISVFAVLFFYLCLPALIDWVLTGYTDTALRKFALVCYSSAALMLIAIACIASYARRVLRSGQFPLAGIWVYKDIRVLRGASARLYAWGMLCVAVCFALLAIYVAMLPHLVRERLLPPVPVPALSVKPPHMSH